MAERDLESSKRILWIVPRSPWPVSCGASYANVSLMRTISSLGWQIDVICVLDARQNEPSSHHPTGLHISSVTTVRLPKILSFRLLRIPILAVLLLKYPNLPLTVIPFAFDCIRKRLIEVVEKLHSRIILWDGLHPMALIFRDKGRYSLQSHSNLKHIYRAHNIESDIWRQFRNFSFGVFSSFLAAQVRRMERFERSCVHKADDVFCIAESDAHELTKLNLRTVAPKVVPVGVFDSLESVSQPIVNVEREDTLRLVWLGGMNWWPNRHGLRWFFENVWPTLSHVRAAIRLDVLGRGTDSQFTNISGPVHFHGFVDSTSDFLRLSDLLIVPVFYGSGVRVKGLEALNWHIPCLGTRLGLVGLPDEGVWMRESARDWLQLLGTLSRRECHARGAAGKSALQRRHSESAISETVAASLNRLWESQSSA